MSRRVALGLYLGVCVVLAALLVTKAIAPVVGGGIFAIALVVLGGLSRGFRGR